MPNNFIGEIRRSAVLMSNGPGAVIDMRADGAPISMVSTGLEEWDKNAPLRGNLKYQKIVERRLCKKLGKKYFRLPPVLEDGAKVPGTDELDLSSLLGRRYPEWLQCPNCDLLKHQSRWAYDPGRAYRYCMGPNCTPAQPGKKKVFVVPVRFVSACRNGHLDEFPWSFWVPHKDDCIQREEYQLKSTGPGLAGLIVSCVSCKKSRSMDGSFSKTALTGLGCKGRRPWLRTNDSSCECNGRDGSYRVLQRGASNLYYPAIESALDIPPWTRNLERTLGDYWDTLADIESEDERLSYIESSSRLKDILRRENLSAKELNKRFSRMIEELDGINVELIREDEYKCFTSSSPEADSEFEIHSESVPFEFADEVGRVVRVARLREVRVLKGFSRIESNLEESADTLAPISVAALDWLPAIEVRGEGVFIELNRDRLADWEVRPAVKARCEAVSSRWEDDFKRRNNNSEPAVVISPRYLLVHTLAHAMIKQLTLECGYSSASLRERLYISEGPDGMAGFLIYTATPDADGTLGGLQRRAKSELIKETLASVVRDVQWCSSDPLCGSGDLSSPELYSIASCHSCVLVPETSCELFNKFLDRGVLIGSPSDPQLGFFKSRSF